MLAAFEAAVELSGQRVELREAAAQRRRVGGVLLDLADRRLELAELAHYRGVVRVDLCEFRIAHLDAVEDGGVAVVCETHAVDQAAETPRALVDERDAVKAAAARERVDDRVEPPAHVRQP